METAALVLVGIIGALHVWILVLEMFLWTTPKALKAFGMSKEEAETSKVLAANQGLYNGFLAAGLLVSFALPADIAFAFRIFFLGCVAVAGLYGGFTAKKSIIFVQTVPALIALALLTLA